MAATSRPTRNSSCSTRAASSPKRSTGMAGTSRINADDLDRPGDAESARGSISMAPAAQLLRNSYSAQTVCRNPAWSRVAELVCRRILTRRCRPLHRPPRYEPDLADAPRPAADPDAADDNLLDDALQLTATPVQPTGAKFARAGLLSAAIGGHGSLRFRRNASAAPNLLLRNLPPAPAAAQGGLETRRIVAAGAFRAADAPSNRNARRRPPGGPRPPKPEPAPICRRAFAGTQPKVNRAPVRDRKFNLDFC